MLIGSYFVIRPIFNFFLLIILTNGRQTFLGLCELTIHKVSGHKRLHIANLVTLFIYITLDLLTQTFKFLMFLLEFLLFGLEHGYHVQPNLYFLIFGQFELLVSNFLCSRVFSNLFFS